MITDPGGEPELDKRVKSISVVIVVYRSSDVILNCLDSLLAQSGGMPRIVVVDNSSPDDSRRVVEEWAARNQSQLGDGDFQLVVSPVNSGFAGGVNLGLATAFSDPATEHVWILNPDTAADRNACTAILNTASEHEGYGMMGGRVCYASPPHLVQIDGGIINKWTGATSNYNQGLSPQSATFPRPSDIDFITGASVVVSRQFYDSVGPMKEDYFLYYEEVDWALRRGNLALVTQPNLVVYHEAGTAIGSPTLNRLASPFSVWFKYRSRMKFVSRFYPASLPVAVAFALAHALRFVLRGAFPQADALTRAVLGLRPPKSVSSLLSPEAARLAFGGSWD